MLDANVALSHATFRSKAIRRVFSDIAENDESSPSAMRMLPLGVNGIRGRTVSCPLETSKGLELPHLFSWFICWSNYIVTARTRTQKPGFEFFAVIGNNLAEAKSLVFIQAGKHHPIILG